MATKLPEIIGLPPLDDFKKGLPELEGSSLEFAKKIFPILTLYPKKQSMGGGMKVYNLIDASKEFQDILKIASNKEVEMYDKTKNCLNICFQHTNQFSETYNNQYGQGLLTSINNFISPGFQEASQMGVTKWVGDKFKKAGNFIQNTTGKDVNSAAANMGNMLKEQLGKYAGVQNADQMTKIVSQLMEGGKFNFPQFWKSSSYDVNYDIHVKLYNLNPANDIAHQKYITGPLMALLAFVNPRSVDGQTFKWPLMCEVKAEGLFHIKTGYIRTISITKGGDSNSVAWNMRPNVVDVRISFGTVYNVKCASEGELHNKFLPSITNDYEIMMDKKDTKKTEIKKIPNSPNETKLNNDIEPSTATKDAANYHSTSDIATGETKTDQASNTDLEKEGFSIKRYIQKMGVSSQNLFNFTKNLAQKTQEGVSKARDLTTKVKHGIDIATSIKSKFSQHTTNGNIAGIQGILGALGGMDNNVGVIASNLNSSISQTGNMVTQVATEVEDTGAGKYVSALNAISDAKVSVAHSTTQIREAIPVADEVKTTASDTIESAKNIRDATNPEFNDSMEILGDHLESTESYATELHSTLVDLNEAHADNAEYINIRKNDLESIISQS